MLITGNVLPPVCVHVHLNDQMVSHRNRGPFSSILQIQDVSPKNKDVLLYNLSTTTGKRPTVDSMRSIRVDDTQSLVLFPQCSLQDTL